jgi:predicted RNA-binding protein
MAYYTDLFSPETYEAFSKSDRSVSGFRTTQRTAASKITVGDKLVCYMTELGRWVGVLKVLSECYEDDSPIFLPEDDPFIIRFRVEPSIWLEKEYAIPIKDDRIWTNLSFTRGLEKTSPTWTGKIRRSLNSLDDKDGIFLEQTLLSQANAKEVFEIDQREYDKLITHKVRRADKVVAVSIPQDTEIEANGTQTAPEVRESIKVQALLASIGSKMGFKIWLPRSDRQKVFSEWSSDYKPVLDVLPLNYDETTLKTIEQIDILWLRGRSIVRAFEVEHTTSIYSGILRMADLLALQPNMNIKLHIVAPDARRGKVFQEIRRPVFSLLENNPLSESCTYLSYETVREVSELKHLEYLSDAVLDEYAEEAE